MRREWAFFGKPIPSRAGTMPTEIKCPSCGHQFPMEEAVSEEYKKELRAKMEKFVQDKEKEFQKKQEEFVRREQELRSTLETNLRKSIGTDYENKFRLMENANRDNEEKLKAAREKELQFLKKEQELVSR